VFPTRPTVPAQARPAPDWAAIHDELRSQKHVTLQLVWQEYKRRIRRLSIQPLLRALRAVAEKLDLSCGKSIVLEKNCLSMSTPNARAICCAIRLQPHVRCAVSFRQQR